MEKYVNSSAGSKHFGHTYPFLSIPAAAGSYTCEQKFLPAASCKTSGGLHVNQ